MPKKVRWKDKHQQPPRIEGYVETVEDSLAEAFAARGLVEVLLDLDPVVVREPEPVGTKAMDDPDADKMVRAAPKKK